MTTERLQQSWADKGSLIPHGPLGYAIVGGLEVSQLLTLFATPMVYIYLDRLRNWRASGSKQALSPAE